MSEVKQYTLDRPTDLKVKKLFGTPVAITTLDVQFRSESPVLSPDTRVAEDMALTTVTFDNGESRNLWINFSASRTDKMVYRVQLVDEAPADLAFVSTLLTYVRQVLYFIVGSPSVSERVRTQLGGR